MARAALLLLYWRIASGSGFAFDEHLGLADQQMRNHPVVPLITEISALGLGLVYALWPFITGLMGALVLYVVFSPLYRALIRSGARPGITAGIVVLLGLLLVVGPGISFIGLLANQAQDMAQGVLSSPLLARPDCPTDP